ncbi:osmosensitive potassium channel sensor histidine kinase KdpD, USP_OKCHK and GAF domain-containing [Geotalea daltonii FRC-32]|uniref:histidine kinase n=2 Tax=Geotalea TaxID=2910589 RepID=B9M2Y5_GEODF|nr:osmosensitive potassium channel sensor histidine kinase KdpD, USP_OKCHK and GAF domain-containing [Geotalea daltonii FRC-32]
MVAMTECIAKDDIQETEFPVSYGPIPFGERLMVCVSGSPFSDKLIRTTHHLAKGMNSPWMVVYIETTAGGRHLQENRERVWNNLRLAETLGAQIETVTAASVAEAIVDFAVSHKVTKIVVGKPKKPRWLEFLRPPLVDRIIYLSGYIDVYVVSIDQVETKRERNFFRKTPPWAGYATGVALVTAATLISKLVHNHIAPTNLVMIYLLVVVLAAVRLGRRAAILTATFSVLAFDFFIVPPHLTLAVSDSEYLITFLALFMVGVVISSLVATANERADAVRQREVQTSALYRLSRSLAAAVDVDSIVEAVVNNVGESLKAEVAVFLPDENRLKLHGVSHDSRWGDKEQIAAESAFYSTRTEEGEVMIPDGSNHLYLPLQTKGAVRGILGIKLNVEEEHQNQQVRRLLDAFAAQTAMALERAHLARQAEHAQILQAREKLERALLNSVSHDLRTPLVSITGALSTLRNEGCAPHEKGRLELVDAAWEEAERLNRFVGNLLDMTRVEAGELKLKKEPCDIQDLVGCALAPLDARLQDREVLIDLSDDLPLVQMDMVFMTQVLVNLLENGMKYSTPRTPLAIWAKTDDDLIILAVEDRGPGVPEKELVKIFDKFYRVPVPEGAGGTGLGLSICKGIVEAHGGTIRAENIEGGGLRVLVAIPLNKEA